MPNQERSLLSSVESSTPATAATIISTSMPTLSAALQLSDREVRRQGEKKKFSIVTFKHHDAHHTDRVDAPKAIQYSTVKNHDMHT